MATRKQAATGRRGRQPAPANEDNATKFVRLAQQRVSKAITAVRNVSKLANRNSYTYTDAQVEAIVSALRHEVDTMEARFESGDTTSSEVFTL